MHHWPRCSFYFFQKYYRYGREILDLPHHILSDYLELDLQHSLRHPFLQFLHFSQNHNGSSTMTRMNDFCCVLFYVHSQNVNTFQEVDCAEKLRTLSIWLKNFRSVSIIQKHIFHKYITAVNEIVRQQPRLFSLTISPSSWSLLKSLLLVILALQIENCSPHPWILFLIQKYHRNDVSILVSH